MDHLQAVEGGALYLTLPPVLPNVQRYPVQPRGEGVPLPDPDLRGDGHKALSLDQEDELVEPPDEEGFKVRSLEPHLPLFLSVPLGRRVEHDEEQPPQGLLKETIDRGGLDLEAHVRGVVQQPDHATTSYHPFLYHFQARL